MAAKSWQDVAEVYAKSKFAIDTFHGVLQFDGIYGNHGVYGRHDMAGRGGGVSKFLWSEHKPVLKHRDDMTEAEIAERDRQGHKVDVYNASSHATTDAAYRLAWEIEHGIDVFGLIENGFAIRASIKTELNWKNAMVGVMAILPDGTSCQVVPNMASGRYALFVGDKRLSDVLSIDDGKVAIEKHLRATPPS